MEDLQPIDLDSLNPDPGPEESGGLAYVMRGGRRLRQREYAPYIPTPMERRIKAAVMAGTGPGEPVDPNMVTSAGVGAVIGGMGSPSVLANPARIDRAKKIAATLDIPFAVAYDNEAGYAKALETHVPDFWKEAGKSTLRAIGSSYVGLGHGMEMLGYSRESADVYRSFGRQMQDTYATHIKPQEFTLSRVADPAWWATTVVEGLTSSLSLVPGALVAGYTGMVLGPAIGLGTFGTTVLAALGATAASRPFEAILEASQTKEQLIREGWDEGLADKQAEFVFQQNMRLGVADVAQIVTAFTPMTRMMSQAASQVLAKRVGAAALKFTGLGASEAIEEIWQQGIQQAAIEGGSVIEKVRRMNPEMREAGVIGALMGYGLGGAGSAYNALTSHVESRLSRPVADKYEEAILARKAQGMDDHSAKLSALDEVAGTPEGKKDIQDAIIELKDIVEGRPAAETDKETMDRAVDAYIKSQENQPDIVPPTDIEELTNEETLDAVARGEVSIDEVLGVEPEPAIEFGATLLAAGAGDLIPALKVDDVVVSGELPTGMKRGQIHADLIEKLPPDLQEKFLAANDDSMRGFLDKDGNYLTREEATALVGPQGIPILKPESTTPQPPTLRPAIRVDGEVKFTDPTGNTHAQVAEMMVAAWNAKEIAPDANVESGWVDENGEFISNQEAISRRETAAKIMPDKTESRFISEETYEAAKKALKEKTSGLHAGFDPTALGNMITIGAYHIENGLRTFSAWSKQMVAEFGDVIKPYLQTIWDSSKAIVDLKSAVREVEGATQSARQVKPQVRRATGQNVVAKMIREDEALRAAMKKAEQASRIAYREGNKAGIEQAKADIRDIVIKAKVKAELFGFREGFNVAQRLTTKEMSQAFREDIKRREQTAKAMVDLIQEQLPPHLRGKLLDAVADRMTNGHINETLDRIEQMRTRNIKKELIEEINEFKNYKGDLDIQYKKRLDELLGDINTNVISAKTMRKLKSFMDWADENGMPSGIGAKMRANLERFQKTQVREFLIDEAAGVQDAFAPQLRTIQAELTIEELQDIRDTAKHLIEMGKLKRRLKLRYDERERDKAIERVLSTTQNMDYEYSGEDTNLDKLKKTALYTYLQQRSPLRVGRRMDGNIWGENTKMFQKISYADSDAQAETRKRTKEAMLKIHEVAPDIDWTDDDTNHRIAVNVYAAMPNTDPQVLILMEKFGWQEIPELNAQEKAAVQILVKEVGARQDVLAAMTEELYNREFVKVPNYFPFKYEGEFHVNPVDGVLQTAHMTQSAFHGMTEERKQHVLKTLRTDVLGIFEQAINEQEWFIHVQPALDDVRQVVTSHRFHEAAGDAGTNYWLEHLDIVARRGWTTAASKANQSPWARILKVSRKNIAVGILAFRPTTILLQPTAIFPALAYVNTEFGPKAAAYVAGEFIKMWTIPGHFNKVFEKGQALQNRKAGDVSVEDLLAEARTGSATDRFTRYGMGWIIAADVRTAAGVQQGIENYLTEMGVPDAHLEAETVMQLVSASSDVSLRPHMFARGEFARTMLTFQSFISNTWDILADDIVRRGLIQGDVSKKIAALVGIGLFVMAKMSEDEIRKFYYMVIGRGIRKEKDTPFIVDATFGMMSNYPVLGAAFDMMSSRGGAADIPLNKLINDMIGGAIVGPLTATEKTKAETIQKGILRGVKAGAIVFGGRPGTGPIFDVLEGILFPEQDRSGKPGPMKLKGAQ